MECPKLSHIDFSRGKITLPTKTKDFGVSLNHLRSIRLSNFNDSIEKILYTLDDRFCNQIEEFTVEDDDQRRIVNVITRFKSLTRLHFLLTQIETTNTKYLFESCTKLVKLIVRCPQYLEDQDNWRRMLRYIKENCKDLREFQIFKYSAHLNRQLLNDVADTLSNIKFSIIQYDTGTNAYSVEQFRKISKLQRTDPF